MDVTGLADGDALVYDESAEKWVPGEGGGGIESIVAGANASVDNTDPANPVVSTNYTMLSGRVSTYASLPSGLGTPDSGVAYLVDADHRVYVWNGSAWPSDGSGSPVLIPSSKLNISDKSSSIKFLGDNRTVQSSSATSGIIRGRDKIIGKKYFEALFVSVPSNSAGIAAGVANNSHSLTDALGFSNANGWAYWGNSTGARSNGVTAVAGTAAAGDLFGFAVDQASGKMWILKNGVSIQGDPVSGTSPIWTTLNGDLYPAACPWLGTNGAQVRLFFDEYQLWYPIPSGFSAIP